ncbi:MAG: glycosyltransferase [Clostridia bacterium]|nr:glycosyltransferase [Clostridia bacterium]
MIITVVCDIFGEESNGTIVVTMNLIRFLQKQNHTVRVLCADQTQKGVENFFVVPNENFGKSLNSLVERVGVSLAKPDRGVILRALDNADHVHIMLPLSLGLATAKIARKMNIPITAGFHMQAENMTSYLKLNKIRPINTLVYKYIYRRLYRYCDGIHYPTEFIRRVFESRIKKTTAGYVISNGVHSYVQKRNAEKPEHMKDKFVILSIGRYSSEKSQDTLIKAVYHSAYRDKIQLILAGQGLKDKKYKRLSKNLPVQPIFRLYGREEIIDVINYCDLYVHPAVDELEGIACLESIACGKMTIVSNSENSATKDFAIDGKCVFKHKNPKDLARVIDYWIENPKERAEYERKYLESSVVYRQEDCMLKMAQMIAEAGRKKQAETNNIPAVQIINNAGI